MLAAAAPPLFEDLALLVVAGSIVAYLSSKLGTVPIIGFLVAGAVIGPNAAGLVSDIDLVNQAADIGVILLLFTIGIEFSLSRLRQLAALILGGGAIQVVLTTGLVTGLVALWGADWQTSIYTGMLVALSSTAIVLKLLADRRTTASPTGRVAVSFLIFQDLAVVAMVLVVPMLGGDGGGPSELLLAFAKAIGIVVAVLIAARTLMPKLLEAVARTCSAEIFLLAIVAVCFGTAYLTSLLEVSVSLGAFLAGLMVSESRLSEQALGDIMPLQILFSATFFISVGMLLDFGYLADHALFVAGLAVALVAIKLLGTAVAAALLRQPKAVAASSALVLAQVGEFSFVLERVGADVGLVPAGISDGSDAFIAVTVVLMVATPFMIRLAELVAARFDNAARPGPAAADIDTPVHGHTELHDHILVVGYGDRSKTLVRALELAELTYLITTLDPDAANEAVAEGRRVLSGDIARRFISEQAGIERARVVVVADDEVERVLQVGSLVRAVNQHAAIFARTATTHEAAELQATGLFTHVVADDTAATDALLSHALGSLALPERLIEVVFEGAVGTLAVSEVAGSVSTSQVINAHLDPDGCEHTHDARPVTPSASGCQECVADGDRWVHLRVCLVCGHVGCCDSSPRRHARGHFHETGHPLMASLEPGDHWAWCYLDRLTLPTT